MQMKSIVRNAVSRSRRGGRRRTLFVAMIVALAFSVVAPVAQRAYAVSCTISSGPPVREVNSQGNYRLAARGKAECTTAIHGDFSMWIKREDGTLDPFDPTVGKNYDYDYSRYYSTAVFANCPAGTHTYYTWVRMDWGTTNLATYKSNKVTITC